MKFTELSDELREQFERDGFLILRNVLEPDEVTRLRDAGDRLVESDRTEDRQQTKNFDGFRRMVELDDVFLDMMMHEKTFPYVVQLMSANLHLVSSHLIYRHPDPEEYGLKARYPGWHRDIANTPSDLGYANMPRMEIKVAYYLSDLSEPHRGSTLFSPGSHLLREPLDIPEGEVDPLNVVEPLLNPGDAVLFENRTWHAGGANRSPFTRKALMYAYAYGWMRVWDTQAYREETISKVSSDIERQLLGGLKDPEGRFIPGGIHTPLKEWCLEHGVVPASRLAEERAWA